jgi:prepilin-type N-terminal cleavage/methylation domain-containing protein
MKKRPFRQVAEAFTLVELLVVAAILAILAALLTPALDNKPTRATTNHCINNLREVGLALQMFAEDSNGHMPPQISITNGGSLELISSNSPALHFQTLSNYSVHNYWRAFHCPADETKQPLTNNGALSDRNVSYFVSVDATWMTTNAIHAGDRNLEPAGQPVKPGLFTLTTNATVGWTREMHTKRAGTPCGNVLFIDAHVENLRPDLAAAVRRQGLATNHLAVP